MQRADDTVERAVRSFAAAMLGEISHELNNRLATMRETVGLLEDLAHAGKTGAAAAARAHASLDEQVGLSLNIVRSLGSLGVTLGASAGAFDAGAAVGDLLALTERWARRHALRVESDIPAQLPPAAGDPALLLCLVHRWLARCAEIPSTGGGVLVRIAGVGSRTAVLLLPTGARRGSLRAADDDGTDIELALRLGAGLTIEGGGALTILLAAAR